MCFQPATQHDGRRNSPFKQINRANIDILPFILTQTQRKCIGPQTSSQEEAYWATMNDPDNNNNRGRSTPYNTRTRASLSSQNELAQDIILCTCCGAQHPTGDCPTALEDTTPSPIRRVAQVQQQVEQVIQQELDTLHVFNEVPPPTGQDSHGELPNFFEAEFRTFTQERENAPPPQDSRTTSRT